MKKRHIPVIFAAMAAVFFAACPTDSGGTGEPDSPASPDSPDSGDGKTYILFKNASPYAVDIYSDSERVNKEAAVPAGGELKLEWAASPDGFLFFLSYRIPVGDNDDITIPVDRRHGPFRIDEGKSTSIPIESPDSSSDSLTDKVYLLLYNEGNSAGFRLVYNTQVISPEKIFSGDGSGSSGSSLVNPRERAWYTAVNPGPASAYSITVSGVPIPFAGVTEFQAGRLYIFRYADGGLALDAERPLSLEALLTRFLVIFDADGGSPETQTRVVNKGDSVGAENMPTEPAKSDYTFGGWYTEADGGGNQFTETSTVNADITVYARWNRFTPVPAANLQAALTWLNSNAEEGSGYTITLRRNETIGPKTLSYSGKNISITLDGETTERTVSLSESGSLFTVGSGVTLTLGSNVTLRGRSNNTDSLVRVEGGGALEMKDGSKISGNTASYSYFSYGGGVYVGNSGTFTMSGGKISGNTASSSSSYYYYSYSYSYSSSYGGGVCVGNSGTFTMSGGEIRGNTASASSSYDSDSYGGGVYVGNSGTFTKSGGGTIYGSDAEAGLKNTANSSGHAVYVDSSSAKKRNTTAGPGVDMDSRGSGTAGSWE
jgi:uncharacterized repeat protein (TIGR02543 family)